MIRQRFFSFVVVSLILLGCAQKGGDGPKADAELSSGYFDLYSLLFFFILFS